MHPLDFFQPIVPDYYHIAPADATTHRHYNAAMAECRCHTVTRNAAHIQHCFLGLFGFGKYAGDAINHV